jgi:hypothetical protein
VRFPLDGIAAFKFLLDGGFSDFYAVLRAHLYFYRNFFKIRQKRRQFTQTMVHGIYKGNLVKEYYLHKKNLFSQLDPADFAE